MLARNWTFVIYPEECYKDFLEKLENLGVAGAVSPLHTLDEKKKHYHVLISGEKKSDEQIYNEICSELGEKVEIDGKVSIKGVTRPKKVINLRSMTRYFLHLDNKDKQQFEENNKDFGGFDSSKYLKSETEKEDEKYGLIKKVVEIIRKKEIETYLDLIEELVAENDEGAFRSVCDNAYMFNAIVRSCSYSKNNKNFNKERLTMLNSVV